MNDSTRLEEHPESARLRAEIEVLQGELAGRLAELHELEHVVGPNLLAIYQRELGPWELRLLEARCEAARWKRRAELARAALNRGESFDLAGIDARLEEEFRAWQARITEAAERITRAQFRLSHLMDPADSAQLKQLFRSLARRLHPDLNPGAGEGSAGLWHEVVDAYEAGDLAKLQALAIVAGQKSPQMQPPAGLDGLREEHRRLVASLEALYKQLREVRQQPPFSEEGHWSDPVWLARRRQEVEGLIEEVRAQVQAFIAAFPALAKEDGHGQRPDLN